MKVRRSSIVLSAVLCLSLSISGLQQQQQQWKQQRYPLQRRQHSGSGPDVRPSVWIRRTTRSTTVCQQHQQQPHSDLRLVLYSSHDNNDSNNSRPIRGDALREASGRRPSLHPLTINAVADLLKVRARSSDTTTTTKVASDQDEPLQVAMQAARVAAEAIARRQKSSQQDGMSLTVAEQQTVAGRVVGVALRWSVLETALVAQCRRASWVLQYGECDSFGVLAEELARDDNRKDSTTTTTTSGDTSPSSIRTALHQRIQQDPLFGLNRAECLLALFLHQVEIPELQRKNVTVPDDSVIDFLDADRKTVLLLQQ